MKSTVKESMSKGLVTIRWNRSMQEAADLMEQHRFRHLPVTDEMGVVVGILSDRDVNRAMSPSKPGFAPDAEVCDYMNWPVITVDQNLSLREAAEGMIDEKISAFLVTDQHKKVIGIVTTEDLLKVLASLLSDPGKIVRVGYSPVVGELIREAQSLGI